jgi:cysteine synthase
MTRTEERTEVERGPMFPLSPERQALYERLESQIGNTPLYELQHMEIANGCRIFCKGEHKNPTGSHYDRETLALLRGKEEDGVIVPGPKGLPLFETTTGSSGASLAWLCRVLGFRCQIAIPGDMPGARIHQIESYGAEVIRAEKGMYIRGLVAQVRDLIDDEDRVRKYSVTDHSTDLAYGPAAMEALGREILDDLAAIGQEPPDYFVCMVGTGISAHGLSNALGTHGTSLVAVEPRESPTLFRRRFPDDFKLEYPDGHDDQRHEIYGTAVGQDANHIFTSTEQVLPLIDRMLLVDPSDWKETQVQLMDLEGHHVGHSSAACVWAARELAKSVPAESTILTIFYDASWRYLPTERDGDLPTISPDEIAESVT